MKNTLISTIKNTILIILLITFMSKIVAANTNHNLNENHIRIAITKTSGSKSYENYKSWILKADSNIIIVDLINQDVDNIDSIISTVDGLLLSGGPDIDPIHFGKVEERDRCTIDLRRDSIEINAIESAKKYNTPILGICRGLQLLNVVFGGTLYTDIPTDVPNHNNHQQKEGDAIHNIKIEDNTLLKSLVAENEISVNSNHHQSIDRLAKNFIASGKTEDGIVEAIEYKPELSKPNKQWIFAVQWHPERLDFESSASGKIAYKFLEEVKLFKSNLENEKKYK